MVLLHAGVADVRSWRYVVPALSRSARVVTYDRRGFGKTTYQPESYRDEDDLLAILDAVGADQAVLVGNSQGGRVAIDFALAHPSRVTALVLVAPAISGAPDPASLPPHTARLDAAIAAAEAAADVDAVNRLEAHLWLDGPSAPEGRVGGEARELFLDMNRRALGATSPGERRVSEPAYDRLSAITAPVTVIVGALDLEYTLDNAKHIVAAVPNGTLVVLPDVAHLPQLEQPAAFNAALAASLP